MPRNNNRFYSNSRNNSSRGNSGRSKSKFTKANNYNMLNYGTAFLDETDAAYEFKARIMLKTKDGEQVNVFDGDGKGDNEFTPEESAMLIAKALLEDRAINICFFANDDGSWGGNARIDITDLREPAKAKRKSSEKPPAAKRKYEIPEDAGETEEDDDDTEDDEDLAY